MTAPAPERRKTLIASKNKKIRELQMGVAGLVAACPHNIVSSHKPMLGLPDRPEFAQDRMPLEQLIKQDNEYRKVCAEYQEWMRPFEECQKKSHKPLFDGILTEKQKKIWDEFSKRVSNLHVWNFGGASCSICGSDFGWYCPTAPNKYCVYEKTDMDDCDYCHLPEERK